MQYQAVILFGDVQDALEVAEILAPLRKVEGVKVGTISPRPDIRAAGTVGTHSTGLPVFATPPKEEKSSEQAVPSSSPAN